MFDLAVKMPFQMHDLVLEYLGLVPANLGPGRWRDMVKPLAPWYQVGELDCILSTWF